MRLTPPMDRVAEAFTVNVPTVALLMVRVQVAVRPENATDGPQVVGPTVPGGVPTKLVEMFAGVAAVEPFGICVTVIVKMCALPISFTLVSGEMVMFASGLELV